MRLKQLTSRLKVLKNSIGRPVSQAVTPDRLRGRRLQARNARVLARDPLCKECLAKNQVSESKEVDHKIPLHLGGPDTEDNLQGLCIPCHQAKSEREAKDRANGSTHYYVGQHGPELFIPPQGQPQGVKGDRGVLCV